MTDETLKGLTDDELSAIVIATTMPVVSTIKPKGLSWCTSEDKDNGWSDGIKIEDVIAERSNRNS